MNTEPVFAKPLAIIASGGTLITTIFALFGSVLKELLPYVEGAQEAVNFVSFGTLIIFLALTVFIRKRIKVVAQWAWASLALLFLAGSVALYFPFKSLVATNTYRYPIGVPETKQIILIGGELHARGRALKGERDMADTIASLGGPDNVKKHGLLWTSEARVAMVERFVRYYAAITFLMTSALSTLAILVWRGLPAEPRKESARKKLTGESA
ncbi:MAG TPA: hypothetical protein VGD52_16705 [Pseudoduganella sp.]